MVNVLAKICAEKRLHVEKQKTKVTEAELSEKIKNSSKVRGFFDSINKKVSNKEIALIAEVKKASPSKGLIREDFDPIKIARSYQVAGASCISVLTDYPYFQGKDEYLEAVRKAVDLPIIRKDFMVDPYQVTESRVLGADCILLIMAALSDSQANEIESAALELDLDVLIEVHDEKELERALNLKSKLLGVNNRNLKTLEVDLKNAERLVKLIPNEYIRVCESGISSNNDIKRMQESGFYTFLVGETLMRKDDIEAATIELIRG